MFGRLSIAFFIFALFLSASCGGAHSQARQARIADPAPMNNKVETAKRNVEFKGVRFAFDPQIFGEVEAEELDERLLENETDKPDGVAPRRIVFRLRKPGQSREATITVYPIADFKRVWAPVEKNSTKRFDQDLSDLRKAIEDAAFRVNGQIPYLPFVDAEQTFQAKVKKLPFPSGEGITFLTQIDIEPSLVNNEGLTCIFQGLSGDEKHYVLAEFPVGAPFLAPHYEAAESEGYRLPADFFADASNAKKHRAYVSKMRERLEKLPPDQFAPNLLHIEEVISSLSVAK